MLGTHGYNPTSPYQYSAVFYCAIANTSCSKLIMIIWLAWFIILIYKHQLVLYFRSQDKNVTSWWKYTLKLLTYEELIGNERARVPTPKTYNLLCVLTFLIFLSYPNSTLLGTKPCKHRLGDALDGNYTILLFLCMRLLLNLSHE